MKKIFNIKNKTAIALGATIIASSMAFSPLAAQTVTGLSDFTIYLDPGHEGKSNQGLYNYSEAEKTVRVGLAVRDYLQTHTDIKKVYMSREDDNKSITLTARISEANALGVDFYYSIHSDAGTPDQNSTLLMYGGWAENGVAIEKFPAGGKAFGEIITPELTGTMRIPTRGLFADRMYYDSSPNHNTTDAYLQVNRQSNMASLLSEGGHHTNPTQQQRNLNAEWKRMEGLAAFRTIVKYAGGVCPDLGFLAGIVTDDETGVPVNGATIKITSNGKEYTTDSYESLFNKYTKRPDLLHNGFYFFDDLNNGDVIDVEYSAPGHQTETRHINISTSITGLTHESLNFTDVELLNLMPAKVKSISARNLNAVSKDKSFEIEFTRKMDKTLLESALSISPATNYTATWIDDYTLHLDINDFEFLATYTLTIDGSIAKNTHTDNFFDGDGDGVEGGDYVLTFTIAEEDTEAPYVVSYDPELISKVARPVIRIEFSELVEPSTIALDQIKVTKNDGSYVDGILRTTDVNEKTVIHYLFNEDLEPETNYNVKVEANLEDLYGNKMEEDLSFAFQTQPDKIIASTMISDFEKGLSTWRNPDGSGSTAGIIRETSISSITNDTYSVDSQGALMVQYQWDEYYTPAEKTPFRIRLHNSATTPKFDDSYTIQSYVFGDGSGANFRFSLRDGGSLRPVFASTPIKVDWIGWKLLSADINNTDWVKWFPNDNNYEGTNMYVDAYGIEYPVDVKPSFDESFMMFDDLRIVKLEGYSNIYNELADQNSDITIALENNAIAVSSESEIKEVNVYTLSGVLVKSLSPKATEAVVKDINYTSGVYIVKVVSETSQKTQKFVVR